MKRPRNTLKTYFQKGKKPTEEQFSDTLDSFVHKDDSLPIDNVEGLRGALDSKLDQGAESELIKVFDQKLEEAKNTINKAYLGIAKPASTAPGIGSFWFRVEENNVTSFPNLKDASGNPISTVAEDFEKDGALYDVTIEVKDGVAKKELSQKASNITPKWSGKPYNKGTQVIHAGCIWKSNAPTANIDVPGVSDRWDLEFIGVEVAEGTQIFQLRDKVGNDIFHIDENGNTFAMFAPSSILSGSVAGLDEFIDLAKEKLQIINKSNSFDILQIVDAEGNVFASIEPDGTIFIPKLRVGSLDQSSKTKSFKITKKRFVQIPDLGFFKIKYYGALPTDVINRTPEKGVVQFITGDDVVLATFNCELAIQGNYSTDLFKKGYSLDLYNDDWKSVNVKLGKLPALKGFHLKAYATDMSHVRDVGSGRMMAKMIKARPFPDNLFKPIKTEVTTGLMPFRNTSDATFFLDGIPCAFHLGDNFFGLYTCRLKKSDATYAIDSSNPNVIFLDSQIIPVWLGEKPYATYEDVLIGYEQRSPKSKSTTQVTKDKVVRFFKYMNDIYKNVKKFGDTHKDYLVLLSWIDFLILCEVLFHHDVVFNNAAYITYDGEHWHPVIIDIDLVLGNGTPDMATPNEKQAMSFRDIWPKFESQMLPQIKERYTYLRQSGVLSMESFVEVYGGIQKSIPADVYARDYEIWGRGEGLSANIEHLYGFADFRLKYLDKKWLNA